MNISTIKNIASSRAGRIATAAAIGAAATAIWVEAQARRAEREHPPTGRFLEIDGVNLHYVERGEGPPVVLLHGNTVTLTDFDASGLIGRLAKNHRVIAFDRPGFGHSNRPRDRLWTPMAQAALLQSALDRLGVELPVLVGHSMGTMTVMAMALSQPDKVRSVVLLGGYFYPSMRVDALLAAPVALPVVGDVMRHTVTALSGRAALKGLVKLMFTPKATPDYFFAMQSREMMLRPVQLRANAEDAAFMVPAAKSNSQRYHELKMPVTIIAGAEDKVIAIEAHSKRLHDELPQSELRIVPDTGHMVHYVAQEQIVAAVDRPVHTLGDHNVFMTHPNGHGYKPQHEEVRQF